MFTPQYRPRTTTPHSLYSNHSSTHSNTPVNEVPSGRLSSLSASHLKQTYLQQFRLVSPENAGPTSTIAQQHQQRPPLLEPAIAVGNKKSEQHQLERAKSAHRQRQLDYQYQQQQYDQYQQQLGANAQQQQQLFQYTFNPYAFQPTFAQTQPITSLYSPGSPAPYDSPNSARPYSSPSGPYQHQNQQQQHDGDKQFPSSTTAFDEKEQLEPASSEKVTQNATNGDLNTKDAKTDSEDSTLHPLAQESQSGKDDSSLRRTTVINPSEEWIVRRSSTPISYATAAPPATTNGSKVYTLRRPVGSDVLDNLTFPTPSPADLSRIAEAQTTKNASLKQAKEASARAVSLVGHLFHQRPIAPLVGPSKTIFDDHEEMTEADIKSSDANESTDSTDEIIGFRPSDEDIMDLYFFLTDDACPIFKQPVHTAATVATASYLSRMNLPSSSANSTPTTTTASRHRWGATQYEDDSNASLLSSSTDTDATPKVRYQTPAALSALAERVGLDLPHLAALREAAGGSVRHALAYLHHICPTTAKINPTGGVTSATAEPPPLNRFDQYFDPFAHMDDLIHTIRVMRERDQAANLPPPTQSIRTNAHVNQLWQGRKQPQPESTPGHSSILVQQLQQLHQPTRLIPTNSSVVPHAHHWSSRTQREEDEAARAFAEELLGLKVTTTHTNSTPNTDQSAYAAPPTDLTTQGIEPNPGPGSSQSSETSVTKSPIPTLGAVALMGVGVGIGVVTYWLLERWSRKRQERLERTAAMERARPVTHSEIIILGCGSSTGVPRAACVTEDPITCETCRLAMVQPPETNKNWRGNPSILIRFLRPIKSLTDKLVATDQIIRTEEGEFIIQNIQIDICKSFLSGVLRFFPRYGIRSLDGVLITHEHADALLGMDDVRSLQRYETNERGEQITPPKLPVYVSVHTMKSVRSKFGYLVSEPVGPGVVERKVAQIEWPLMHPFQPFQISGLDVMPLPVLHGEDYVSLGFLFGTGLGQQANEACLYISDVTRIPQTTWTYLCTGEVPTPPASASSSSHLQANGPHFSSQTNVDFLEQFSLASSHPIPKTQSKFHILPYEPARPTATAPKLALLIVDALFPAQGHNTHFSLSEALELIERLQPRRALITGMSDLFEYDRDNGELLRRHRSGELTVLTELCYDGLRIPIKL